MAMMRTPNKLIETEQEECSAEFHPPSGKLAAVTRKGNELQTLINEQTKNEVHFKITYHEYKQKIDALKAACEEQDLGENVTAVRKAWWEKNYMPIVNLSISVEKYLKEIEGAIPKKWQSKASLVSKGTSISSISARVKLAERKAKLEAEKVYSKRLTELEEQELAYKRTELGTKFFFCI